MSVQPSRRKFRVNPIEVMIFGVVAGIFLNSLANLVAESRDFKVASLTTSTPLTVNSDRATGKDTSNRALASVPSKFASIDLSCEPALKKDTAAEKIRLAGSLCTAAPSADDASVAVKAAIVNEATRYSATVFQDGKHQNYSTDYIPLIKGSNPIRIQFSGAQGKSFSQSLEVVKN